jgi:hydroxypyruvate isomerase
MVRRGLCRATIGAALAHLPAMPNFAANLTMLYNEVPLLDRFERAARSGFRAVEFLFPYEHDPRELRRRLDDNGLQLVLHNLPPGNWEPMR